MPSQLCLPGLLRPVPAARPASAIADLRSYPDVPSAVLCEQAKALGAAGEALVDSLLLRYGETVLGLKEWMPADRLVLRPEGDLALQIKTTTHPDRHGTYGFPMKKGYRGNPNGMRSYAEGDYDIAALVVLPENVVCFVAGQAAVHRVTRAEIRGLRADPRASFDAALAALAGREPDTEPAGAMPVAAA